METYAVVFGGTCINIASAEPQFAAAQGWVLLPEGYGIGDLFDGQDWSRPEPAPAQVTPADVIAERTRRLALGFDHDFGDGRGVHRIGTTPEDMAGWDEVSKLAQALIATGNGASGIAIITDTGPVAVTADEWQAVLLAAGAFRQPIWGASFLLQAAEPIPADYADDGYWP